MLQLLVVLLLLLPLLLFLLVLLLSPPPTLVWKSRPPSVRQIQQRTELRRWHPKQSLGLCCLRCTLLLLLLLSRPSGSYLSGQFKSIQQRCPARGTQQQHTSTTRCQANLAQLFSCLLLRQAQEPYRRTPEH
jgi:hypothetical protein